MSKGVNIIELRLLKYFKVVAEEETISQAAQVLHITQPTLSRQIKELEESLNTQLFIRDKRKMLLTEAGRFLKEHTDEILFLTDQTENEFKVKRNELFSGHIAIGCIEGDNSDTLAMMIEEFKNDYPKVTYHIYSGTSDDIKSKLDKGLLDLAILLQPVATTKYESFNIPREEKWGMLVSRNSEFYDNKVITKDELLKMNLLISGRQEIQKMISTWSEINFNLFNVVGTFNLIFNVISLVENNVAQALTIAGATLNRSTINCKFIPLYPEIKSQCTVAWKKNRSLTIASEKFLEKFRYAFKA